jgi:D-arabinose 1-dehydrogenase-like Zn-dependent alcohol dehydrogenase
MATMRVIEVRSPGADFQLAERAIPEPKQSEVLIKVEACGICHGDSAAKEGRFPGVSYPRVPGHEVIGTIHQLGSSVSAWKEGQRVGVGWHGGHCFDCEPCRSGEFGACDNSLTTGLTTDGGYAEYMIARVEVLHAIPEGLAPLDAAPLLCAGGTSLGALRNSGARGGDLVAIQGLGGLGHLAVQYAAKLGCKTVVLSRGKEKEKLAYKLGAHAYIDTKTADPAKELKAMGGAQVILCTAPSGKAVGSLVGGLARRGHLILVAFSNEPIEIPTAQLLLGARSISGWVGGNIEDTIRFSVHAGVTPMIEVFPLERAAVAYEKMMSANVLFRAVLNLAG